LNEKSKITFNDDLIRRALQIDIESVEPPAADIMWRNIEACLDSVPAPLKKTTPIRIRYAALAIAACLLLVFGGIGLVRVVQFDFPASEFSAEEEIIALGEEERLEKSDLAESGAAEAPVVAADGSETEMVTVVEFKEGSAKDQITAAVSPPTEEAAMPLWPATLGKVHFFSEEIVLPPVEEGPLRVALYTGPDHDLLLVSSNTAQEDSSGFVEKISLQMQFPINDIQYKDGNLFFAAGGYNGLVFQHDGMTWAILAPYSTINKEQLINLAAPFR